LEKLEAQFLRANGRYLPKTIELRFTEFGINPHSVSRVEFQEVQYQKPIKAIILLVNGRGTRRHFEYGVGTIACESSKRLGQCILNLSFEISCSGKCSEVVSPLRGYDYVETNAECFQESVCLTLNSIKIILTYD